MNLFKNISIGIMCLCVGLSALYLAWAVPHVLNSQLTSVQNNATMLVTDSRKEILATVNYQSGQILEHVDKLTATTDRRLASIQKDTFNTVNLASDRANTQLTVIAQNTNAQLNTLNNSVGEVTKTYAKIPQTLASRFDIQTDCERNSICWQNMLTDTLRDVRYSANDVGAASKTISESLPLLVNDSTKVSAALALNIPKITNNVDQITISVNRLLKPHWYDRVLGYSLAGVELYRAVNPATLVVESVTKAFATKK